MMFNILWLFAIFSLLTGFSALHAEYRYALLIKQDAKTDFQPTIAGLEKFGFQCTEMDSKDEKNYRYDLPRFIAQTATNSTVLVVFKGNLSLTKSRSREHSGASTYGLGVSTKMNYTHPFIDLMESLQTSGGSKATFFFLDAPNYPEEPEYHVPSHFGVIHGRVSDLNTKLASESDLHTVLDTAGEIRKKNFPKDFQLNTQPSLLSSKNFVLGKRAGDEWVNSMGMIFTWCPPGDFVNGEGKVEKVTEGFWIMKYEWALGQVINRRRPHNPIGKNKLHPMTHFSHRDIKSILKYLTESEEKSGLLPGGFVYALPSETQWEYAARAGSDAQHFFFGDDENWLPQYANFADKSYYNTGDVYSNYGHRVLDDGEPKLALVGSYKPNAWGIYDMHGNLSEVCANLKCRGGSYVSPLENCKFAHVDAVWGHHTGFYQGFRFTIQKLQPEPSRNPKKK
jgi:formylglycine-generating enzyme required for sulfatase activity